MCLVTADLGLPTVGPTREGCGWALLGGGRITAEQFVPALLAAPSGNPVTVWDASPAAAAQLAALLPGARVAASLPDAVADKLVTAAFVATAPDGHLEAVLAAAAAKRAVLVTRPLAATLADAEDLVAACDGLVAGTSADERWHPAHLLMGDMVEQGELGAVTAVRVVDAQAMPGLDLLAVLLGEDAARLAAQRGADGGLAIAGATRRGVLLSQHVWTGTPTTRPGSRVEVVGTGGVLTAVDTMGARAGGTLTLTGPDGVARPIPFDAALSPATAQVERFSLAALGASPWGYHLLRDLRLQRLLAAAGG